MFQKDTPGGADDDTVRSPLYSFEDLSEQDQEHVEELAGDPRQIELIAVSDILPSGDYGRNYVILCSDTILVSIDHSVTRRIPLNEISAVLCRNFVGNGLLEARTKDEGRIELARYSRTLTDSFQVMADHINDHLGVSDQELAEKREEMEKVSGPKEERPTYRCPSCGHPLSHEGDACPKCAQRSLVFGKLLKYLKPLWPQALLGFLFTIIVTLCNLGPGYLVRQMIDRALLPEDISLFEKHQALWVIVGLFFGIIVIRMLASHVRIKAMGTMGQRVVRALRQDTYRALQRLSLSYFDREHTGRIMSRVLSDTQVVQGFIVESLQHAVIHVLMICGISIILFRENALLAAVALGPIPIVVIVGRSFSQRFKWIFRSVRRRFASLSAALNESVSGVRVVKSFAQEDREYSTFSSRNDEYYDANIAAVNTQAKFRPSIIFLMTLGTIVVYLIGGRQVLAGSLSLGLLMQFITYMTQFYAPVQALVQLTEAYQRTTTAAERVFGIINMPTELSDHDKAVNVKDVKGRIEFRGVSFQYQDGERILKNVDLAIEPGKMLGVVGQTGAGKSTLVSLVCRFYDPTDGDILLDGASLKDITMQSLRSQIGMVLQDTFLFARTIRDNIAYGTPHTTNEEIIEAAKAANAHEFIMNLPDGYDSDVGERGIMLSGGEKQRISIARAILKNPAILILDEATSAVDSVTEASIQEAMDRLIKGRTTIAIAHRLSTLRNADKLIVIDNGEIAESGTHIDLMKHDGIYAGLCRMQADFAREIIDPDRTAI